MKIKIIAISLLMLPLMANAQMKGDSSMVAPGGHSTLTKPALTQAGPSSERTTNHTGTTQSDENLQNQINALKNYIDSHLDTLYAQLLGLENAINNLNHKVNSSGGSNCGSRKHGQIYNVQTGGGDDSYYSTLYQCFDGSVIPIGKNNMANTRY